MIRLPDVVRAYIDAYNRQDVEGMVVCLCEDVTFSNISDGEVTAKASNRQAFAEMAKDGVRAFKERHQEVTNAITVACTTLVEINYRAVVAMDLPNGWKAGQELSFSGASAFRIKDGKIICIIDQS